MRNAKWWVALAGLCAALSATAQEKPADADWVVPDVASLPDDKYGRLVREGKSLVEHTYRHIGPRAADPGKRYAGNNLACASCHVDAGTKKFGNPFVGTFADYPQYRPREHDIQTIEERVNGCMERSMNGRALPVDSREMKAIVTYLKFLSSGVPVGKEVAGRGMPRIELIGRAADPAKGRAVYEQACVACHGADGQGLADAATGGYAFPPLWGPDSYNDGAGMARVIMAARFIRYNMPKGVTHDKPALTAEQAFDVAAYINGQERPRKANLDADFPARTNKPVDAAFPPFLPGATAEQHRLGPFAPLVRIRDARVSAAR